MAVMSKMRDLTKIILYILVLAFVGTIIFDWGMNYSGQSAATNAIGEVEGTEISARDFDLAVANQLQQYRQQTGNDVPDNQVNFIRNQVWESFVQSILVSKTIEEKGIKAHDQEIVYILYNAPPAGLKQAPVFQDESKQFDMDKYLAALNNPNAASMWRNVEDNLRQTIPAEKLQQRLQASVRVTDEEVKREYIKQNQKARVEYVLIEPRRFDENEFDITDEIVQSYYNEHQEEYKQEEKRAIEFAIIETLPTAEDSLETMDLAERVLRRALDGEDFAELAEIYSEDTGTRDKGGDLGFFSEGAMVKEFEEAAFGASEGDIVGPVKSQFGLHVIKVEEKRTKDGQDEVKARHILFKFEASSKTVNAARDNADYIVEQVKDLPFAELVAEIGDSVQTTGLFVKGSGFVPRIGLNQTVSNFVFRSKVGDVGNVEQINQGYLVYRVSDIQAEHIKPMEEVVELIKNKLLSDMRMSKAGELAQNLYEKLQESTSFENAATQDSLEVKQPAAFTRSGSVSGVGRDVKFIGAAFALNEPGQYSPPVAGTRGYYVLKLVEKDTIDEAAFEQQKEQLALQLGQRKQNQAFADWYADLKSKADIKDYRDRFF